ncbi:hypothetical protein ASF06_00440 [Agreia sp. Leaf244]|uniref:hypothetical protein n=1 Tax=Agreia sp. Leaf244 TaxID=1736305 RepID=UPI0006F78F51|nr:hypothetical protein [Agreia sp. Leaf244]KQO11183.1 hypothetical protein ASF06_00440 [Agreia sp. Leaf244]
MLTSPPADLLRADELTTTRIRRGPWQVELRAGELDDIRHAGRPVLRSVRVVVRDRDWRTLRSSVERIEGSEGGGQLVLHGSAEQGDALVRWRLTVETSDETLIVALRAEAESDFLRNRLGLIVLHSPELAGRELTVEHPDGGSTNTAFPIEISPHQPALDIRALSWTGGGAGDPVGCRLELSGDVFEMEDQRNWTDASYKTYSTPLSVPFPVEVRAGDVIEQSLTLACSPARAGWDSPADDDIDDIADTVPLTLIARLPGTTIPRLTTMASTAPGGDEKGPQAPWARELLVELDPATPNWGAAFERAIRDAGDRQLDVRLIAAGVGAAEPVLDALAAHPSGRFARIGLFGGAGHLADTDTSRALVAALDARGLDIQVIAGTRAHFTELNRGIDRLDSWRGPIAFSITPFMHDTSGHQLVESVAMQRQVVGAARRLADGRPLHIGPITLGARFNAVATTPAPQAPGPDLQAGYGAALVEGASDPRTGSASLAAWLVASVASLAAPTALTLCFVEEWGQRAASHPQAVQALTWLSQLEGATLIEASAPGLAVIAAAPRAGGRTVLILGNLSAERRAVSVPGEAAPVQLGAGQVARIELRPGAGAGNDRLAEE